MKYLDAINQVITIKTKTTGYLIASSLIRVPTSRIAKRVPNRRNKRFESNFPVDFLKAYSRKIDYTMKNATRINEKKEKENQKSAKRKESRPPSHGGVVQRRNAGRSLKSERS